MSESYHRLNAVAPCLPPSGFQTILRSFGLTDLRTPLFSAALFGLAACADGASNGSRYQPDPYGALTDIDVSLAARLLQRTLDHAPDGTTRRWTNDESGHSGAITPMRSYIAATGQYCRDYREDLSIDGQNRRFLYSACRNDDRWGL